MARLQGQRGGGGVVTLIIVLILLVLLYLFVLAPLFNWPLAIDVLGL